MKHLFSILTAVFAVLAFLVSCGGSEGSGSGGSGDSNVTGETGSIYGIVTDKATGESIINAGVELQPVGLKTVTGSDGQFEFNEVATGTYTLYVTKTGYSDNSSDITVESGKQSKGDVQLEKLPAALRIVNDDGKDISELDFGSEIADVSRQFNIFNDGYEKLEWELSFSADWIKSVSKEGGELKAGGTQGVIVNIDRNLLESGENTTTIHVTSNNGNKQLPVRAVLSKGVTRTTDCQGLPENAEWNTVSTITQTYDGREWKPSENAVHYDAPSTTECRFKCIENYLWNGTECIIDPCVSNPCKNLSNSTGICVTENLSYYCECEKGFLWSGTECLDPCESNPCQSVEHSTGICTAVNAKTHSCGCEPDFLWSGDSCLNPCESNPCVGVANSTEVCTAVDAMTYSCGCEDGFTWDKSSCEVFCSTLNITPCKDHETNLMWSAKSSSLKFTDALIFCANSKEGGFDNWRVPTIDELRSLLNCSNTGLNGECKVSAANGCLSSSCCNSPCNSCGQSNDFLISKFGDSESFFWSSSIANISSTSLDRYIWCVNFNNGTVVYANDDRGAYVRCVR